MVYLSAHLRYNHLVEAGVFRHNCCQLRQRTGEVLTKNIIPVQAAAPTGWNDVVAAFQHDLYQRGKAEATISGYGTALRGFGEFYRGQLDKEGPWVASLQETDLQAFMDYLKKDRLLAPASLNRYIAALRAFAHYLLQQGWHRRDLGAPLKSYRLAGPGEPETISAQEVRRLVAAVDLNAAVGPRDQAILQLALQGGLRVGEISRLCVNDVAGPRDRTKIRVRDQKGRGERFVPLNASARNAVQNYLAGRGAQPGHAPLFVSNRERRIATSTVKHLLKKYLCSAGRADLSAHDLRHHFARSFYEQVGGKLPALQQVLGHRHLTTTARYASSTEKEIRAAIESLPENAYAGEEDAGHE